MVPREDIKGNCRTIVAAARGRPVPSPGVDEFPRRLYAVRVLSGSCTTLQSEIQEQSIDYRWRGVFRKFGLAGRALWTGCGWIVYAIDKILTERRQTGFLCGFKSFRKSWLGNTDPRVRIEGMYRERRVRWRVIGRLSRRKGRRENAKRQQWGGTEVSGWSKFDDFVDSR